MEPDITKKLEALEVKIDSIDTTVKKIRRVQRNASVTRIAYWTFIILLGAGALWFLKPFMNEISELYGIDISSLTN